MPFLEIHDSNGATETRELSRDAPVLIGRAESNDICIQSAAVAPIHCRISAKGGSYLLAAATPTGVMCNGTIVVSSKLSPGDVLRIGDAEIIFVTERGERLPGAVPDAATAKGMFPPSEEIRLQAISSDEVAQQPSVFVPSRTPVAKRTPETPHVRGRDEPLLTAAQRAAASVPPPTAANPRVPSPAAPGEADEGSYDEDPPSSGDANDSVGSTRREKVAAKAANPINKLGIRPVRPGEQDALRSPLVLSLGGGALLLLLTAATLWFILGRESAQRKFDAAQKSLESGLYAQAIEGFETFLKDHPRHALSDAARVSLGTARVDQAIAGSTPAWDRGLEALDQFIVLYKDSEEFQDPESALRRFVVKSSGNIALGAAEAARIGRKKALLKVSADAARLLELYESANVPPLKLLEEIAVAVRGAQAAILRQETFDDAAKQIDAALARKDALAAFDVHRRLLNRYHDFTGHRPLDERLQKAIRLEQTQVIREELSRDAVNTPRAAPTSARPLSLARRTRTRSDEASGGEAVFAIAEDCCYGIDTVTGEPLWRRVIGLDPPFFPVPVDTSVPALLLFDAPHRDLLLLEQVSGKLLWRQPLGEVPSGAPLVHAGQIFQATVAGHLYQIDLGTGRVSARLKFPQPVSGPPALSNSGDRLYLSGHRSVLYLLKRSPLACEAVAYLGHASGAIQAPLLMMRSYLLVAENDRLKSCKLRVLDATREEKPPAEIASTRIDGQVHEPPVLRGKQLFVPSSPERIHAFTVSETKDRHALALAASFQVKNPKGGPIFLAAGPDDQMWMASSALRRFQLVKDSLRADKQQLVVGLSTQPFQVIGDSMFLGKRLPYSRAVFFSEVDRERMVGQWQIALGSAAVECSGASPRNGEVSCLTATGDVYVITAAKLKAGGFELQPAATVPLPDDLTTSLRAARLADGRMAAWCGGAQPRLWTITADGLVQHEYKLSRAIEAAPLGFAGGLLLPLPGRLKVIGQPMGESPIEDFRPAITKKDPPRWRGVTRLDDAQVLAVNEEGRVARIQYRTSPVAHLAEIAHWDAASPVDIDLAVDQGRVFVADALSRLTMLDANSLEPRAEVQLGKPATQSLWLIGQRLFVEVGGAQLTCFDVARKLEKQWSAPLPEGVSLAGAPLAVPEGLIIALRDGQLWKLSAETGETQTKVDLKQPIVFGPQRFAESLVVGTLDGSLIAIDSLLKTAEGSP